MPLKKAYDDCYHRAIQGTLLFEHRLRSGNRVDLLTRDGFKFGGVIIEGDEVGDGITGVITEGGVGRAEIG